MICLQIILTYGGITMLIQIMRDKNHYDYVKEPQLDKLITQRLIEKFKRTSGWVTLGVDPVRDTSKNRNESKTDREGYKKDKT